MRALAARAGRGRGDVRVVAEGPQAVREALKEGAVVDLWLTAAWAQRESAFADAVGAGYVHLASERVLEAMSPAAQGVLAVVRWEPMGLDALGRSGGGGAAGGGAEFPGTFGGPGATVPTGDLETGPRLVAVFEAIRDPGNAGTAIRAADAAGADAVVFLEGSVDPRSAKVIRASAGSCFHLPVIAGVRLDDGVAAFRALGCQILAADGEGKRSLTALEQATHARWAAEAAASRHLRSAGRVLEGSSGSGRTAGRGGTDLRAQRPGVLTRAAMATMLQAPEGTQGSPSAGTAGSPSGAGSAGSPSAGTGPAGLPFDAGSAGPPSAGTTEAGAPSQGTGHPGTPSPAAAPDLRAPTAWLFGNEARGLTPEALALADATIRIPIHGRAESLNLAMAATLCLYSSAGAQRT